MRVVLLIDLWPEPMPPGSLRDRFQALPPVVASRSFAFTCRHFSDLDGLPEPPAGIILSGSRTNLVDDPAEDPIDGAPLSRFAPVTALLGTLARTPVLGICFGHQLLARCGGGRLERMHENRSESHFPITPCASDPLLQGLPSQPAFVENHQWRVVQPASGYRVLARSRDGIEMVRHQDLPRVGVQFHPEYYPRQPADQAHGRIFLNNWLSSL